MTKRTKAHSDRYNKLRLVAVAVAVMIIFVVFVLDCYTRRRCEEQEIERRNKK